jgi:hypothetical protein
MGLRSWWILDRSPLNFIDLNYLRDDLLRLPISKLLLAKLLVILSPPNTLSEILSSDVLFYRQQKY